MLVQWSHVAAVRMSCMRNLACIGVALHCYEQKYGCFPPAYTVDPSGARMHSWRVLLLPFLGEGDLYAQYTLDEPWNSVSNFRLLHLMPEVYRCPSDTAAKEGTTNYLAVVGPDAAWRGATPLRGSEFKKSDDTIMLVESSDADVYWLEPRDLEFGQAAHGINRPQEPGISSRHGSGANCDLDSAHARFGSKRVCPYSD